MRIYFDTNILNKLAYVENYDFVFERIRERGHSICVSEVTIFEILRDQDDQNNIDKIITMLQSISDLLIILPSISEVLVGFVSAKKVKTKKNVLHKTLTNKKRMFKISEKSLPNLTTGYKTLSKMFRKEIKNLYKDPDCEKCGERYCDVKITEIAYHFIGLFMIMNFQLLLKNDFKKYWRKRMIFSEKRKIDHINKLSPVLLCEISPFREMARFCAIESTERNNGILGDCLHMVYLNFVDIIVSDDGSYKHLTKNKTLDEYLELIDISINWKEEV